MIVYVLETGAYEDHVISGVFVTPEEAMAAWQPQSGSVRGYEYCKRAGEPFSYTWTGPGERGDYHFDADWDDSASITPYEVSNTDTRDA